MPISKILPTGFFLPHQAQSFSDQLETIDEYMARGGVTHFRGSVTGHTLCNSAIGASVRKWAKVNCLSCFRVRKGARAAIDRKQA